jgi:cbb3-type cytochrome oxidase subunit 3
MNVPVLVLTVLFLTVLFLTVLFLMVLFYSLSPRERVRVRGSNK